MTIDDGRPVKYRGHTVAAVFNGIDFVASPKTSMKIVAWIDPDIVRGKVQWPECDAEITADEPVAWRIASHLSMKCENVARVDYRGTNLCLRHAKDLALREAMGGS